MRGVLLRTVPELYNSAGDALTGPIAYALVRIGSACLALGGLYLTFVGWTAKGDPQTRT